MFRHIGIVSKMHAPAVRDALSSVLAVLNARDCDVRIDAQANLDGVVGDYRRVPRAELPESCDLVISIGGDGTLLQCAGLIYPRDVALLGINLGRLGFLTDLPPAEIESGLNAVLDGEYLAEERAVLGCDVIRDGRVIASEDGLNDVVVQKWNTARPITLNTFVDGKFLHSQRADGMIVATTPIAAAASTLKHIVALITRSMSNIWKRRIAIRMPAGSIQPISKPRFMSCS